MSRIAGPAFCVSWMLWIVSRDVRAAVRICVIETMIPPMIRRTRSTSTRVKPARQRSAGVRGGPHLLVPPDAGFVEEDAVPAPPFCASPESSSFDP